MKLPILLSFILFSAYLNAQKNIADFGQLKPLLASFKGTIYSLPDTVRKYTPSVEDLPTLGYIYSPTLNISERDLNYDFPGVPNKRMWFGIVYKGVFELEEDAKFEFQLASDDGSALWIDGKGVINNDGIHKMTNRKNEVSLTKGFHRIVVWYFQAVPTRMGLQLVYRKIGDPDLKPFNIKDHSKRLTSAAEATKAQMTDEGIKVNIEDKILFDVNKYDIKTQAQEWLNYLSDMLQFYPRCQLRIEGHCDITGNTADNQILSDNRAKAVAEKLKKLGIPNTIKIQTIGYGATRPVANNTSEKGRALNRRVELVIIP
jgi:outer membrane protein OmpA-like peptidoglycan-associated protein